MRVLLAAAVAFFILTGCVQQPAPEAPLASSTPVPTPIPTTPTEWTGEKTIIYWTIPPFFRILPTPSTPPPTPTPVPTPNPPTGFGLNCTASQDCPDGYFCNWFERTYFKYGANGSSEKVLENYGDRLCRLQCFTEKDCGPGEKCVAIERYRGPYPVGVKVCAKS
ncbi:MAG: hypothetical protein V1787_05485 [Candidatus Micrarchaeota archaeon]